MTYFGFLLRFLLIPIVILVLLTYWDRRSKRTLPASMRLLSAWSAIAIMVAAAVIYTTPWDNYLVATKVWWYDPALVTGITLGWVPLEEYTFFVLQAVMTGLWLLFLARRIPINENVSASQNARIVLSGVAGLIWLGSIVLLLSGWKQGRYLALELVWALPPILMQVAIGGDILWHHRRLVGVVLLTATSYLIVADFLAIDSGTWTINPDMTVGIRLGGILPIEEVVFFLITNTLLVFGLVLAMSNSTLSRLPLNFKRHLSLPSTVTWFSERSRDAE